jgi:hypothetical protein
MSASWDETSKPAGGWDGVSAPLTPAKEAPPPGPSPEEIALKKAEAKKLAEEREAERKAEAARQEELRIAEKKAADKKVREARREERNALRLKTLQRGFLIDQFADTCRRLQNAVRPVAVIAGIVCALVLGAGVTYKVLTTDFNCRAGRGDDHGDVIQKKGQPGAGDPNGGDPNGGADGNGPDGQPRKPPRPAPDGDGTPDDPNGIWGWTKYFKDGKPVQPTQ